MGKENALPILENGSFVFENKQIPVNNNRILFSHLLSVSKEGARNRPMYVFSDQSDLTQLVRFGQQGLVPLSIATNGKVEAAYLSSANISFGLTPDAEYVAWSAAPYSIVHDLDQQATVEELAEFQRHFLLTSYKRHKISQIAESIAKGKLELEFYDPV